MAEKMRNEHHGSHSVFLCGEASNETGRFRGGGIQRGQGLPWHTILPARSSVLYLLRRRRRRGLATGQRKDLSATPGQAGFAGWMAENAGACEKQSPPGRQRLRALGWSKAEEKRAQPSCRRYIKSSRPPSLVFCFFPSTEFLRFFIFRFLTHGSFSHFAFSELNRFMENSFSYEMPVITFFKQRQDRF